jgi:hypothetical protein
MHNTKTGKAISMFCIALEFPPFNTTGSFRYVKFLKHLHEHDIRTTIICPTFEERTKIFPKAIVDERLLNEIKEYCTIIEVPIGKVDLMIAKSRADKIISAFKYNGLKTQNWKIEIIQFLKTYLKDNKVDFIFSSIPPYEIGLMASEIADYFKIKFLLDIRDEWSLNKSIPFATYFQYRNILKLERKLLERSYKILVVTPELISILRKIHKKVDAQKFHLLTNGFDFDELDFKENLSLNLANQNLNVAYSGSFYYDPLLKELVQPFYKRKGLKKIGYRQSYTNEDWSFRSPYYFLAALNEVFKLEPNFRDRIFFHYVGNQPSWLKEMIDSFNLRSNFIGYGFVTKSRNLEILSNCNALLLTTEKVLNGRSYCISSKIFDYFSLNKLILAFVTEGDTKDLLLQTNNAKLFNPDDTLACAREIIKMFNNKVEFKVNVKEFEQFTSSQLTKKLNNIIRSSIEL